MGLIQAGQQYPCFHPPLPKQNGICLESDLFIIRTFEISGSDVSHLHHKESSDDCVVLGIKKNMERFTNLRVILAQGPC